MTPYAAYVTATAPKPRDPASAATRGPDVAKYVTPDAVAPKAGAKNDAAAGDTALSPSFSSSSSCGT